MNINKSVKQQGVDYSMDTIKYICNTYDAREPGSKGERDAQEHLANDVTKNGWADEVKFEEFNVAPKAFMGFSRVAPILMVLGLILFPFVYFAPLVFNIIGLVVVFFEFLLYKEFLDPFYKKSISANMIATKKPTGEVKRRIIFSGHADAAYEWSNFYKFGSGIHIGGTVFAAIGAFVGIAMSILSLCIGFSWWQLLSGLIFLPGFFVLYTFSNRKIIVPGANDNLTGCLASIAVLKYMKEANLSYENTEVVAVITGSEEAGLRGAKAWAKAHKDSILNSNVETVFVGLETFREIDHITIYKRDLTGLVEHHAGAIKLLDKAAAKFDRILPHESVYIGASDSAAITQAKIPAVTLAAMDPAPARYYHTRNDSPDNLDATCYSACMDIVLECMDIFDKDGIK